MSRSALLSLFQSCIILALFIIGGTFFYAISQEPAVSLAAGVDTADGIGNTEPVDPAFKRGKAVWNNNGCGSCHAKSMKADLTGPALAGVTERWAAEPRENLYAWIRNSPKLADSGTSERANAMIDWSPTPMSMYPSLTDAEIEDLLTFIEGGA